MKYLFLLLLVLYSLLMDAQTVELETQYLMSPANNADYDPQLVQERGRVWRYTREQYPALPYDSLTGSLLFEKVIEFPGITKAQAYRRCKEWVSFSFRHLDRAIDYEDFESGKIIIDGYVNIKYLTSYMNLWGNIKTIPQRTELEFTLVITVVDNKAKVTYRDLRFRNLIQSYINSGVYIPSEVVYTYFEDLFPVVANHHAKWDGIISLIRNAVGSLNATAPSLERYVQQYWDDYRF